ncbi:hypothetical protein AA313_de0208472 [Arthrobotrys entomopaga]|nr:hypothetical protein AA313_de0208472 [Arthrobotrys entomopaga]
MKLLPNLISLEFDLVFPSDEYHKLFATVFTRLSASPQHNTLKRISMICSEGSPFAWSRGYTDSTNIDVPNEKVVDMVGNEIPVIPNLEEVNLYLTGPAFIKLFWYKYLSLSPKLRKVKLNEETFNHLCWTSQDKGLGKWKYKSPVFPTVSELEVQNKKYPFQEQLNILSIAFPSLQRLAFNTIENFFYHARTLIPEELYEEYSPLTKLKRLNEVKIAWPKLMRNTAKPRTGQWWAGGESITFTRHLKISELEVWVERFLEAGVPLSKVVFEGNMVLAYRFRAYITATCYISSGENGRILKWAYKKDNRYGAEYEFPEPDPEPGFEN